MKSMNTKFVVKVNRGTRVTEYVQRVDLMPIQMTPNRKLALLPPFRREHSRVRVRVRAISANEGYVEEYEFGYQKNGKRLVTWRYKVDENGVLTTDERPGKVVPYVDVTGASFFNYLTRNSRFWRLTSSQQVAFEASLPFQRTTGEPPSDGAGYWTSDRNYYAGGRSLNRQTFQPVA